MYKAANSESKPPITSLFINSSLSIIANSMPTLANIFPVMVKTFDLQG